MCRGTEIQHARFHSDIYNIGIFIGLLVNFTLREITLQLSSEMMRKLSW